MIKMLGEMFQSSAEANNQPRYRHFWPREIDEMWRFAFGRSRLRSSRAYKPVSESHTLPSGV